MAASDGGDMAQAEPVARQVARCLDPIETLSQPRAVVGRDAGAIVADGKQRPVCLFGQNDGDRTACDCNAFEPSVTKE